MSRKNKRQIGRRVGVSTVVAIGALATGISVAGAASTTGSTATKAPTTVVGGAHAWDRGRFGDLGAVGTLTAVSSTAITVKDPSGAMTTYALSATTVVRKDGAAAPLASLAVGDNVAVMVPTVGSTSAVTVVIIPAAMAAGEDPGGFVTAVSATSITLEHLDGTSSTYAIDPSTTVREGRSSASLAAVSVGERVRVRPSTTSPTTAAAIEIDLARVAGTVVSVSGSTITVGDAQGFYRSIQVSGATTYSKSGASATIGDVAPGAFIVAEGMVGADHTTLDASSIAVGIASMPDRVPGAHGAPGAPGGAWPMGPGMDSMAH